MRSSKIIVLAVVLVFLLCSVIGCSSSPKPVTIGPKSDADVAQGKGAGGQTIDLKTEVDEFGQLIDAKAIEFGKQVLDNVLFYQEDDKFYVSVKYVALPEGFSAYVTNILIFAKGQEFPDDMLAMIGIFSNDPPNINEDYVRELKIESTEGLEVILTVGVGPSEWLFDSLKTFRLTYDSDTTEGQVTLFDDGELRFRKYEIEYDYTKLFEW